LISKLENVYLVLQLHVFVAIERGGLHAQLSAHFLSAEPAGRKNCANSNVVSLALRH
jgi:hypothetical protein